MQLQRIIFPEMPVYIPIYGDTISRGFSNPGGD